MLDLRNAKRNVVRANRNHARGLARDLANVRADRLRAIVRVQPHRGKTETVKTVEVLTARREVETKIYILCFKTYFYIKFRLTLRRCKRINPISLVGRAILFDINVICRIFIFGSSYPKSCQFSFYRNDRNGTLNRTKLCNEFINLCNLVQ